MFIDKIDPKLNIGCGCGYMNFSGVYESKNALYLSLGFTNLDFIYNRQAFTQFISPKKAEEYISKDNELIISSDIDSKYIQDSNEYLKNNCMKIYDPFGSIIEIDNSISLTELKNKYIDKGNPIIYTCDHYYAYNDYKKQINNFLKFHSQDHMAILCDINFEKGVVYVLDKFYEFKGEIDLLNFNKTIQSSYLNEKRFFIMNMDNILAGDEEKEFYRYLKENFENTLDKSILINGVNYHKNIYALEEFIKNFESIVVELYDKKGKYAPQFLSKLLSQTILQKISFSKLLKYYLNMNNRSIYVELDKHIDESKRLWENIDVLNDKCYLKGKSILDDIEVYKGVIQSIMKVDSSIYKLMGKI